MDREGGKNGEGAVNQPRGSKIVNVNNRRLGRERRAVSRYSITLLRPARDEGETAISAIDISFGSFWSPRCSRGDSTGAHKNHRPRYALSKQDRFHLLSFSVNRPPSLRRFRSSLPHISVSIIRKRSRVESYNLGCEC